MENITIRRDELERLVEDVTRRVIEALRPDIMTVDMLSTEEACKVLKVCESTLYLWEKSGYLIPVRIGRRKFFRMMDVKRIMVEVGKDEPEEVKPRYREGELFG